jgi:hypothetical protein
MLAVFPEVTVEFAIPIYGTVLPDIVAFVVYARVAELVVTGVNSNIIAVQTPIFTPIVLEDCG